MLKQRVLTASVLAPLVIAGIFFLPFQLFIIAVASVTLLGHWEWTKFVASSSRVGAFALPAIVLLGSAFLLPVTGNGLDISWFNGGAVALVGALWWLLATGMVLKYPKGASWWANNAALQQGFGVLTLLPFLWSVLLLRAYHYELEPYLGAKLVLIVCLLVWSADTGAYFAGKRFGKRKMAPSVSPNKTVEGLIGGLIASVAVTIGAAQYFSIPFSSLPMLGLVALVTSFASVLGDLAESMFKRVAGVKDSGSILPGHGGILDRIDSLTAAFPVFTVLYFWLA
ncbi:CDP-diglyceride synthetase [Enterovibrio norvegicus FF-162]|uniref:Phosphatidate cytidylyltransferase n=1 Tax=Enterovibrio norvegicus FF-454 TaxID=1185651 RepID=A0A1E5C0K3_9GAMM|nr:phosphatidate cytidylyltransferase [Enterovibrio norvegicus]OEE58642.1 CDP-diglyceride synthetase [Enterovibrio norvegicus FF-454]OEE74320.1 CDP-diglyceride synthetase [Enterovibrio norvegicus FF-162]